jgi:mersacidin/lichenicidin family type 2 lantibiotic
MNREKIIRAWKDTEYRAGLNESERKRLPEHPAGIIEIPETAMDGVAGGTITNTCTIGKICTEFIVSLAAGGTCRNLSTGCCPSAE